MNSTFLVYIDESGEEGFRFHAGSSQWFVLSAVVCRRSIELETVKLVDAVRQKLGKPEKKPLHFRDLKHEQRLPLIAEIAKASLRVVSVLVHKPSLTEVEKFQERYRLYFYAVRYLLERVFWCCRDHRRPDDSGDGSAEVVFSNRAGMSYDELRRYLALLKKQSDVDMDIRLDWSVIKAEQVASYASGKRMGLQIADAVASGVFYAVEPTRHGFTEDRYVRMLKPVTYHHQERHLGYGLKFWPRETEGLLAEDERLRWVRKDFK